MRSERFEIFTDDDQPTGKVALRSECHGDPTLIHRTAHVVVFNSMGDMLLQKRSQNKDIQPGKWDTAVGGHVDIGESYIDAAKREMQEELGCQPPELKFVVNSKIRNTIESENIGIFSTIYEGPFDIDLEELDEVRFWTKTELENSKNHQYFTPNLIAELALLSELEQF